MSQDNLTLTNPDDFKIVVLSDGTRTTAEIIQVFDTPYATRKGYRIGWGVARRRKGDRRDRSLGLELALARAFRDAADRLDEITEGRA